MIKKQGSFEINNGTADLDELLDSVDELPDGQYGYLLYDNKKNRSLPQLKYLCGVLLKTISDQLASHPPINALYRYFEEKYSPLHICEIQGQRYEYFDLKNEKSVEVNAIIEKIIHHAATQWNITIPSVDAMKLPEAKEPYLNAYAEMWKDYLKK